MRPEEERQGPIIRDRRRIDPVTGQVRKTAESGPQRGPAPAGGQGPGGQAPGGGQPRSGKHPESKPAGTGTSGGASADTARPGNGAASAPATDPEAATAGGAAPGGADGGAAGGPADPAAAQVVVMLAERTAYLQRLQAEYANYRKRVERDRLAVREQALANVLHELLPVLDDIGRAREHGELTGGFKSVADSLEGIVFKLGLTAFGDAGDLFDPTLHEALMHSYSADVTEPTAVQILQPGYKVGERIIRPARVAVAEPGGEAVDPDGEPADADAYSEADADADASSDANAGPGAASADDASAE